MMKATFISLLAVSTTACMSDRACEGVSDVSMCCYMNECVPSSNIGCKASRIDFYKHL